MQLPKDVYTHIIHNMDIQTVENLSCVSISMIKLCSLGDIKNLIRSKILTHNIKHSTLKQIFLNNKISRIQRKFTITYNNVFVNGDNQMMTLRGRFITHRYRGQYEMPYEYGAQNYESKQICSNTLQIIPYRNDSVLALYNDGTLSICKKYNNTSVPFGNFDEKIIHVERKGPEINIITINGKNYSLSLNDKNVNIIRRYDNLIERRGNYFLFNTGDVCCIDLKYKINRIPQIIQITKTGLLLAINGDVYKHDARKDDVSKIPVSNIKQIADFRNRRGRHLSQSAYLDHNGNVFMNYGDNEPFQLDNFSDIIEISYYRNILIMLHSNLKILQYY